MDLDAGLAEGSAQGRRRASTAVPRRRTAEDRAGETQIAGDASTGQADGAARGGPARGIDARADPDAAGIKHHSAEAVQAGALQPDGAGDRAPGQDRQDSP